ncbi:MAG: hypothetical protein KGP29_05160 [Proteobacteria bacterium]|nr:hypothetical protein [Pseudomonadota bacterium]
MEHKLNLEEAIRLGQQTSKEDVIAIISSVTSLCSKLYEANKKKPLRTQDSLLAQMHEQLIEFIGSEEGREICDHENKTGSLLTEARSLVVCLNRKEVQKLGTTKAKSAELALDQDEMQKLGTIKAKSAELALNRGEMKYLSKQSLLFCLFGAVPSEYSVDIINAIISRCTDLSQRPDLLLVMISQRTIASNPDMSKTFDLLVSRGLPNPLPDQLSELLTCTRLSSGNNASKLALSFLYQRSDDSMALDILRYSYQGRNSQARADVENEKSVLRKLLLGGVKDADDFPKITRCLIKLNDDELLTSFLGTNAQRYLPSLEDHASFLSLAAENKMIRTFEILISAGFDPLQRPYGETNPFAIACKTQGEVPLGAYLKAIEEKFGEEKIRSVLEADGTALTHAIEGRGYVDVVTLLEKNGADLVANHTHNLLTAARGGHAGVFDKLLRNASDHEIDAVMRVLREENTSYAIDCVLLDHLKDKKGSTAKALKEQIRKKESSLTERDLFAVCQFNGAVTLKYFVQHMEEQVRGYRVSDHVNRRDGDEKTPLYYAINNNAYNSLVQALLDHEADPNEIALGLDAATLAVRNKESGTLGLLLASGKLSPNSIEQAYRELEEGEENTLVSTAFFEGLREDQLATLDPRTQSHLLETALKEPHLEHFLTKFRAVGREVAVGDLLMKIIEERDAGKLEKLFRLPVKSLIAAEAQTPESVFSFTDERTELIPNSSVRAASNAGRLTDKIDQKYLGRALEIAESGAAESSVRAESVAVIRVLLDGGFDNKSFEKRLEKIGVKPSDCCETSCAVM